MSLNFYFLKVGVRVNFHTIPSIGIDSDIFFHLFFADKAWKCDNGLREFQNGLRDNEWANVRVGKVRIDGMLKNNKTK